MSIPTTHLYHLHGAETPCESYELDQGKPVGIQTSWENESQTELNICTAKTNK